MPLKPIKINLSTFKYQDKFLTYPIMLLAALIVLAISAYNIQLALHYQHEILDYEQRLAHLEQVRALKQKKNKDQLQKVEDKEIQSIREGVRFLNKLIVEDAFPWDRVLDVLEKHTPPEVVLLHFALSDDRQKVIIKGATRSMAEITRFLSGLEQSKVFKKNALINLVVTSESMAQNASDQAMGIKFQIESILRIDKLGHLRETFS